MCRVVCALADDKTPSEPWSLPTRCPLQGIEIGPPQSAGIALEAGWTDRGDEPRGSPYAKAPNRTCPALVPAHVAFFHAGDQPAVLLLDELDSEAADDLVVRQGAATQRN